MPFQRSVPVARRNLFAEPTRLAISVGGVAFAVLLIQLVLSLYRGWSGVGRIITDMPADAWIVQEGTTDPFHSTSLLPAETARSLARVPGVRDVTAVYSRQMSFQYGGAEQRMNVMALDTLSGAAAAGASDSPFFPPEGRIYLDSALARKLGIRVGDRLRLADVTLTVGRTFDGGNAVISQFAFVSAPDARRIFALEGVVNYLLVTFERGAELDSMRDRLLAAAPGTEAITGRQFAENLRSEISESFLPVVGVLVGIGFVVGVAVIGLTTYTATMEKTRDYGVMKALGASGSFLYRIVIAQSLMVAVIGSVLGLGGAIGFSGVIDDVVPEFITAVRWADTLAVFAAALAMAVVASYLPLRRINAIDPAMVFRA